MQALQMQEQRSSSLVVSPNSLVSFLHIASLSNKVTLFPEEMASQLKEGMTREQVRFILGTALLTDMFHEDRWDYPFRLQNQTAKSLQINLRFTLRTIPLKNSSAAHCRPKRIFGANHNGGDRNAQ